MPNYDPSADYAASYDALSRRIASNFAGQRDGLNQELADRGVQTSGVSAIPSATLRVGESNAQDQVAGQFAHEQAQTAVQDRQRMENFNREKELMSLGWNRQDAVQRRQSNAGLEGAGIAGGLGVLGSYFAGPAAPVVAPMVAGVTGVAGSLARRQQQPQQPIGGSTGPDTYGYGGYA